MAVGGSGSSTMGMFNSMMRMPRLSNFSRRATVLNMSAVGTEADVKVTKD